MTKMINKKIKILESARKGENTVVDETNKDYKDHERIVIIKGLRDDGLIEYSPDGAINSSAKVRLTNKGEEHLLVLKNKGKGTLYWIAVTAVITAAASGLFGLFVLA